MLAKYYSAYILTIYHLNIDLRFLRSSKFFIPQIFNFFLRIHTDGISRRFRKSRLAERRTSDPRIQITRNFQSLDDPDRQLWNRLRVALKIRITVKDRLVISVLFHELLSSPISEFSYSIASFSLALLMGTLAGALSAALLCERENNARLGRGRAIRREMLSRFCRRHHLSRRKAPCITSGVYPRSRHPVVTGAPPAPPPLVAASKSLHSSRTTLLTARAAPTIDHLFSTSSSPPSSSMLTAK